MLTVGRVVAALSPDFPDLTISKVRFLEAEGVVVPSRSPSGYRQYSEADVERLRFALTAQRDRFWPLRVVREALDAMDRGLSIDEFTGAPHLQSPAPARGPAAAQVRLTRAELLRSTGLDAALAEDLLQYGLLHPDARGHFSGHDLKVAAAAAELAAYGLSGRHLRAFRTAADREVGLIEQVLTPRRRHDEDASDTRAALADWCIALHSALVHAGLQGSGGTVDP